MKYRFVNGAKVTFRIRGEKQRVELSLPPPPPDPTAYNIAAAHLNKPWARRWMRRQAIQHRTAFTSG